jgi:exodeoxyribonuclease V beta subunit
MKNFDLINAPLKGTNLIEASAGTGKTYTIAGLFVRLILESRLFADQILVVTFTKAATEELKDRIRRKLVQTRDGFLKRQSHDPLIASLIRRSEDPILALRMLNDALIDFDKAAIFTIHGFCQKIIHENAFETGSLYNAELITDNGQLIQEVADDFWRIYFSGLPPELLIYANAHKKIKGPSHFVALLERIRYPDVKIVPKIEKPTLEILDEFRDLSKKLKKAWPLDRNIVKGLLKDPALSGSVYGSLKSDDQQPDLTKRDLKVLALVDQMDQFAGYKSAGYPLFKDFEKFTAAKLDASVRKNQRFSSSHNFFQICDALHQKSAQLDDLLEKYVIFLKTEFLKFADAALSERKRIKNLQFYDDLLLAVRKALKKNRHRGRNLLVDTIRAKYKAAMVDEFQDTDAIQYDIFSMLFAAKEHTLFLIGDPKQSIYGFRGADIFSYMQAAAKVESTYTLSENWRSSPGLITAVNTIFTHVKTPFVFEGIPFEKGKYGQRSASGSEPSKAALKLWYVPAGGKKLMSKASASRRIAQALTDEILRLTSRSAGRVPAGDIAVLVRTNRQAQLIKDHLYARSVPAVLYSIGNIFDTDEAMEIERILAAIAEPENQQRFRSALITDILGAGGEDLDRVEDRLLWWQSRYEHFRQYLQLWQKYGFMRMFREVMLKENIKPGVLSLPDGERRLSNILHLMELIHRAAIENNYGISALLKWFAEQRRPSAPRLEEHQLRLESDALAVNIVTVHKSKGLEYPIVFCPFGWASSKPMDPAILFHSDDSIKRLTLDLAADADGPNMMLAQNELLAENLRLLYVALTRAKTRCYLIWGRINSAETSALAYLLHHFAPAQGAQTIQHTVTRLARHFSSLSEEAFVADLQKLADNSHKTIELGTLPSGLKGGYSSDSMIKEKLSARKFSGKVDRRWSISSYSALIAEQTVDPELPDYDGFNPIYRHEPELSSAFSGFSTGQHQPADPGNIFSFPKGTRTGVFFHELLERVDFTRQDPALLDNLVVNKLNQYGFDLSWKTEILRVIDRVVSVPLMPDNDAFKLASVNGQHRINEMEFYFPLNPTNSRDLKRIFAGQTPIPAATDFSVRCEKLTFSPVEGYMKGYIDMLFKHRNRFYLVDWKSNYLGDRLEQYRPSALIRTMGEEYYFLQYHLYTLAIHQYLKMRRPGYEYTRDFGGVFYIFLRGVVADNSRCGIFHDRPDPNLIFKLGKTLIPGFSGSKI